MVETAVNNGETTLPVTRSGAGNGLLVRVVPQRC